MQKRLFWRNLAKLYKAFKQGNPEVKVSLAKFCLLIPRRSKPLRSPAKHNVFVCQKYQNAVLATSALCLNYIHLMKNIACNTESRICMQHQCESYPGKDVLLKYLNTEFAEIETDDNIRF